MRGRYRAGRGWVGGAGLALTSAAQAHGPALSAAGQWTLDPWITLPLGTCATLYALGWWRVAGRDRAGRTGTVPGASRIRDASFYVLGWVALATALLSPLHWLGEHVFSYHMVEHEIVMVVAAPLFMLARPAGLMLWGLPRNWRRPLALAFMARPAARAWHMLTRPWAATTLHGLAIWIWHWPALFDQALEHTALHRLQHFSFFMTALLFWWSVLRRAKGGLAVWHLFFTMVHTSVLGALIALAPRVAYHLQTADAPAFGLAPLEDQQLAGVIMWVPAETVYAGVALWAAARWIRRSRSAWAVAGSR